MAPGAARGESEPKEASEKVESWFISRPLPRSLSAWAIALLHEPEVVCHM